MVTDGSRDERRKEKVDYTLRQFGYSPKSADKQTRELAEAVTAHSYEQYREIKRQGEKKQ
jgi:hypothetical protein